MGNMQISSRKNGVRVYFYKEIGTFRKMQARCNNVNDKNYDRYGGRGITVSKRWTGRDGFENFLNDMGRRPTPQHSLDRIDNDGNYTPENCRWATRKEQALNRSSNRMVTINGVTKNLILWCEEYGIKKTIVSHRIWKGWSEIDAITLPVGKTGYYGQLRNRH